MPTSLDEIKGLLTGLVVLPVRLSWSGADRPSYDLARDHDRRLLYEVVLTEGTADDVRRYLNGVELLRVWDELWLSPHVRRAWEPLIAARLGRARGAFNWLVGITTSP